MRRIKHILLIPLLSLYSFTLLASSNEGTQVAWMNKLEEALIKAESEDKFVLLYFSGSDWCRPCMQLKEKVFDSVEFGEYLNSNFIPVQFDFPVHSKNQLSEEQRMYNEQIAERYNGSGAFPFIVIINKNGEVLEEFNGYNRESVEEYVNKLQTVISDNK